MVELEEPSQANLRGNATFQNMFEPASQELPPPLCDRATRFLCRHQVALKKIVQSRGGQAGFGGFRAFRPTIQPLLTVPAPPKMISSALS